MSYAPMHSFPSSPMRRDRTSDVPLSVDVTGTGSLPPVGWASKIPQSWVGMSGYLVAGIFLGLVLILALSVGRSGGDPATAAAPPPGSILDNVVRLHARDIGQTCWQGLEKAGPARLTVSLEVGVDGKIRHAAASGETAVMRGCVEAHVKTWEFLPQAQAQTMALPFEIDRR